MLRLQNKRILVPNLAYHRAYTSPYTLHPTPGPARVHLLDTEYPSARRFAAALCHGGHHLSTYGKGEFQDVEYESMRVMTAAEYGLLCAAPRRRQ